MKGVNLGGWLVAERWMTPSLFVDAEASDEYTLSQTPEGRRRLKAHHREFITEEDFRWLASHGVAAVRIPVGYWVFGDAQPYVGALGRLDWAFRMAKKYQLRVLLCLHGAPGSQNGHDHSGRIGTAEWHEDPAHQEQTIAVLERLAQRYGAHPALWGLELLNEPAVRRRQAVLRRFYRQAYERLDGILPPDVRIVFSDAFRPRFLAGALRSSSSRPVAMDIHWYHFGSSLRRWLSPLWFERLVVAPRRGLIRRLQRYHEVVIGEWSGVVAGEVLARYDEREHRDIEARFLARQLAVYEVADAWFYWSYKTEFPGMWHFRSLVESGRIDLLRR